MEKREAVQVSVDEMARETAEMLGDRLLLTKDRIRSMGVEMPISMYEGRPIEFNFTHSGFWDLSYGNYSDHPGESDLDDFEDETAAKYPSWDYYRDSRGLYIVKEKNTDGLPASDEDRWQAIRTLAYLSVYLDVVVKVCNIPKNLTDQVEE